MQDTKEILDSLNCERIEGYDYDLQEDLEAIVKGKLNRRRFTSTARGTPAEQVTQAAQKLLNFNKSEKFEDVNTLIRDTANYYHQKTWKENWEKAKKGK